MILKRNLPKYFALSKPMVDLHLTVKVIISNFTTNTQTHIISYFWKIVLKIGTSFPYS